ncbi:MAG: TetR/AcrR family transcriptional regulator [Spirochaetaceae bacterium]|nr:MAG: TetR/AcrR family transcriptional regulator [Spirochaetaceae bacterium]
MGSKATKETIIATAARLFHTNGYEDTSVQEIIDAVGVSKGAFYHYFTAKSDILESIASSYVSQGLELTDSVIKDSTISGIRKLNHLFVVLQQFKSRHAETRAVVHRALDGDQNLKMEKLITGRLRTRVVPLLTAVLDEARAAGELRIANTREMAELLFVVLSRFKTALRELARQGVDREVAAARIGFYERAICSLLELPEGSINLIEPHLNLLYPENGTPPQTEE